MFVVTNAPSFIITEELSPQRHIMSGCRSPVGTDLCLCVCINQALFLFFFLLTDFYCSWLIIYVKNELK